MRQSLDGDGGCRLLFFLVAFAAKRMVLLAAAAGGGAGAALDALCKRAAHDPGAGFVVRAVENGADGRTGGGWAIPWRAVVVIVAVVDLNGGCCCWRVLVGKPPIVLDVVGL